MTPRTSSPFDLENRMAQPECSARPVGTRSSSMRRTAIGVAFTRCAIATVSSWARRLGTHRPGPSSQASAPAPQRVGAPIPDHVPNPPAFVPRSEYAAAPSPSGTGTRGSQASPVPIDPIAAFKAWLAVRDQADPPGAALACPPDGSISRTEGCGCVGRHPRACSRGSTRHADERWRLPRVLRTGSVSFGWNLRCRSCLDPIAGVGGRVYTAC